MKRATIICKKSSGNDIDFYVVTKTFERYLFSQRYSSEVYNFYKKGVDLNKVLTPPSRNFLLCKISEKLPTYIRYIEQEYDVVLLKRNPKNSRDNRKTLLNAAEKTVLRYYAA